MRVAATTVVKLESLWALLVVFVAAGCGSSAGLDETTDPSVEAGSTGGAAGADGDGLDAAVAQDGAISEDAAIEPDAGTEQDAAGEPPPPAVKGFPGPYASPTIVRVGKTYHAYFAAHTIKGKHYNAPYATFTSDGNWTFGGEALPKLGKQAFDGPGKYPVWAPAVARINANRWMIYYTAQLAGSVQKKCIWRAHATGPEGPFVDDYAGPIHCEPGSYWTIDAYLVEDAQGTWHLAARIDEPGGINTIKIRALNDNAGQFAAGSSWSKLTENAPKSWEQPVLENAGVVRLAPPTGKPHWFVFYSARAWDDDSYAIGYADCGTGINGPCTKKTPNGPWFGTNKSKGVFGPGTPTFYTSETGDMLMSVQAWEYSGGTSNPKNNGQIMRTYKISVDDSYTPKRVLVRVDK